jgi:hypothetical protein
MYKRKPDLQIQRPPHFVLDIPLFLDGFSKLQDGGVCDLFAEKIFYILFCSVLMLTFYNKKCIFNFVCFVSNLNLP